MKKKILLICVTLLMLSGCGQEQAKTEEPKTEIQITTETETNQQTEVFETENHTQTEIFETESQIISETENHTQTEIFETESQIISETENHTQTETSEMESPSVMKTVNIYYPDEELMELVCTPTEFETITAEGLLEKIIEYGKFQEDIKILSITEHTIQEQRILLLDLSETFKTYVCTMGTSGEFFMIQSIVNTFMEAFEADGVQLTVEGNILETGHSIYDTILSFSE